MKLTKLNIESYKHLEGVNFDFTYPEGHLKAGKALEKICLIGQSATGKTSVLELVKENLVKLNKAEVINGNGLDKPPLNFKGAIHLFDSGFSLIVEKNKISYRGKEYFEVNDGGTVTNLLQNDLKLLYLSSEIISKESVNIFNQNPLDLMGNVETDTSSLKTFKNKRFNPVYEFIDGIKTEMWFALLSEILDYRKRFTQMASELINKGMIGDLSRLNKEFVKWAKENENPLIAFAEHFNPILNKLNLEVDLVNTEYAIPIKSKLNDEVIPVSSLSTGTKGLLLSMFPLFEIDTTEAIIFIDEPERSLFPDMQIDLISHYQKLAPNAQFVIATHSPFIAAAFEPEERFILYFDEKGKVAVRRGESPIGDDPNDMLKNDFKINYYNEFGKQAYQDYLNLKREVAEESHQEKKKKLIVELAALGDKYNF